MHKIMFCADKNMNIYSHLANAAYTFHLVEILAIIGLSFVSSSEDYEIHKFCFMTFMLCAIVNMISMCILHGIGKKAVKFNLSREEKSSLKYKLIMFIINAVFFSAALYFFHRHSVYCEEGVYSLFAICEIIVVLTNAGFHATAIIDFHNSHLVLTDFSEK
uniref:CWH43-like N-terminal domain-containing protein n=1 Tax=Arion vulgaris TaxID=1028688 RepID=A0A0B6ZH68_9EUPU